MPNKNLSQRLFDLIPDLEYSQETHRQWRDYLRANPRAWERNPECGDAEFHQRLVDVYQNRIDTVKEAAEALS